MDILWKPPSLNRVNLYKHIYCLHYIDVSSSFPGFLCGVCNILDGALCQSKYKCVISQRKYAIHRVAFERFFASSLHITLKKQHQQIAGKCRVCAKRVPSVCNVSECVAYLISSTYFAERHQPKGRTQDQTCHLWLPMITVIELCLRFERCVQLYCRYTIVLAWDKRSS